MYPRSRTRRTILSLATCAVASSACSDSDPRLLLLGETQSELAAQRLEGDQISDEAAAESPLEHLLSGVTLPDGRVPVLEVKEDTEGRHYALFAGAHSLPGEGGEQISEAGFQLLEVRRKAPRVPRPPRVVGHSKVESAVLAELETNARASVLVWLAEPEREPLFLKLQRATLGGLFATVAEKESFRLSLVEQQLAEDKAFQAQAAATLEDKFKLNYRCLTGCLGGVASLSEVESLAASPLVDSIGLFGHTMEEGDNPEGFEIGRAIQLEPLWDLSYAGHGINGNEVIFSLMENGPPNEEHIGFKDCSTCASRIISRTFCIGDSDSDVTCLFPSAFDEPETKHASGVLGIMAGDPHDSGTLWNSRRGYVTEAEVHVFAYSDTLEAAAAAMDLVPTKSPATHVLNLSAGSLTEDSNCSGASGLSKKANDLYENGILPVILAGNEGNADMTNCTVRSPGSAIGAVTVGSIGNGADDTAAELRSATISSFSSRGGTSNEGGGRAIIDLVAPGFRQNMFNNNANSGTSAYGYSASGTSFATPHVSAAAGLLVDWSMRDHNSFLVNNPGLLHAFLILMGDGFGQSSLYGAGRLQHRLLTNDGLDNPWAWQGTSLCVDDNEEVLLPITSTPIGDIDVLKAAIYFYDVRHENGSSIDDIGFSVERSDTGQLLMSAAMQGNEYGSLARHFVENVPLRLVIEGQNVTADNSGCGQNSMLVYVAWFYEDSDRESAENLGDGVCGDEIGCAALE